MEAELIERLEAALADIERARTPRQAGAIKLGRFAILRDDRGPHIIDLLGISCVDLREYIWSEDNKEKEDCYYIDISRRTTMSLEFRSRENRDREFYRLARLLGIENPEESV